MYTTARQNNGKVLLPHHHIKVSSDMREDLAMWNTFLNHPTVFCCPFMDFKKVLKVREIDFFTDSSGNKNLRMGGVCGKSWMVEKWNPEFIEICNPSIEYLELYALTADVILWNRRFENQRVVVFCDNISVVQMINKSTSSCRNCLVLIRLIMLECMIHNV